MKFERISLDDAAARLADMQGVSKWDTSNGFASIAQVVGNGAAFIAWKDDQQAMLFAIEKCDMAGGKVLQVRIAKQLIDCGDLTETMLPAIEYAFGYDCKAAQIETRRRGLMAKLEKLGYRETSRKYWKPL